MDPSLSQSTEPDVPPAVDVPPEVKPSLADTVEGGEHTYKFNVRMSCGGCSGAVERVLKKLDGISSYNVNREKQEVIVKATISYDTVFETIRKTGKEVLSGEEIVE